MITLTHRTTAEKILAILKEDGFTVKGEVCLKERDETGRTITIAPLMTINISALCFTDLETYVNP